MMNPSAAAFNQGIKALTTQSKGENPERLAKKESYGEGRFPTNKLSRSEIEMRVPVPTKGSQSTTAVAQMTQFWRAVNAYKNR